MATIIAPSQHPTRIDAIRQFLEIYYLLRHWKYNYRELTVLAYYALHGVSGETDTLLVSDVLPNLSEEMARHTLAKIRGNLRKQGVISLKNTKFRTYVVDPVLVQAVQEGDKMAYVIKFGWNEGH
ncbi:hypothetical protein GCM10028806_34460 [Spirosoma terrae]|uniref:Uncharacterized protein n=1 Tax=Spirosoma terrae TaxID=1968276 RepID=A0A6L9L5U4_9BACT|nr:hypothetical protein [Spirosoma terrae]NDU95760.1 hypothetical protein [Spirosoma terrae]